MPQGGEVLQDFVHQQYDSDGNELCARLTNPKTQRCVGSEALHTLQWVPFLWGVARVIFWVTLFRTLQRSCR